MSIFLSGSLAYDYIMDFPDSFARHILPEQLHILSVCFNIEKLQRGWGGTAGNIAYAMQLLGEKPLIASALGYDGREYVKRLESWGLSTDWIIQHESGTTASAHIMTDQNDNQITAFFSGPLARIVEIAVADLPPALGLAIMAPNPKQVMLKHLIEARARGLTTVFDPGQQITTFTADELRQAIGYANILIGNDYEFKLLEEYTGWSEDDLLARASVLVKTLGASGSQVRDRERSLLIKPCAVRACLDPTGAGDAYRAGFFVGYKRGLDLEVCAQMGSVSAAYAVETRGTQEYNFSLPEFCQRYQHAYHQELCLD